MNITKQIDGYIIEVSHDEYEDIINAFIDAETLCNEHASYDDEEKYKSIREELEGVKERYLTDEEAAPLIQCLCCKHCQSNDQRQNGMCKLSECKYEPA